MRNKASGFLKQIVGVLAGLTKARSLALKSKASALKARVALLSLLRNRRVPVESISHKLRALLGPRGDGEPADVVVRSHRMAGGELVRRGAAGDGGGGEEDEKYPDPTHEDLEDPGGSVIDLVKNTKQEGEDFVLEDEIDRVADLFIRRFHRQIRMQKQLSLKRLNEALDRSPQ
ncbi:uncharacterized protein J3R85_019703 [Psidium guajava]|nr:uncharacterized protein J3R85_019703 [Psidium guajava]